MSSAVVPRGIAFIVLATSIVAGQSQPTVTAAAADAVQEIRAPRENTEDGPLQDAIESLSCQEFSRVTLRGHFQQSFTFNPDDPHDRQNFGRLFDDRANDWRLNQLMFTLEQAVDHERCFDWGFKSQLLVGTDARFIHVTGSLEDLNDSPIQISFVDLSATLHWTAGFDWDLKVGAFPSLCGLEAIDATANVPLFSHSYIFNFGVPFRHTGFILTAGVLDDLRIFGGIDTGTNTGITDNNDALGFHGGIVGKLGCDDELSYTLATHVAPDNDTAYDSTAGIDANSDLRVYVDLAVTWKVNDRWTLMADLNYGHDSADLGIGGADPEWYGVAGYAVYKVCDSFSLALRGEVFRDDAGFAVAQFAEDDDYLDLLRGRLGGLDPRTVGGGATTYYGLTLDANWWVCKHCLIQGEVRYDWAGGDSTPFNDSLESDQIAVALATLLTF